EALVKRIRELEGPATQNLDVALANTTDPKERENLGRTKELYKTYIAASLEMADAHKIVLADREGQGAAGRGWPAQLAEVTQLPAGSARPRPAALPTPISALSPEIKHSPLRSWVKISRPPTL